MIKDTLQIRNPECIKCWGGGGWKAIFERTAGSHWEKKERGLTTGKQCLGPQKG